MRISPLLSLLFVLFLVTYPTTTDSPLAPDLSTAFAQTSCPTGQYRAEYFNNPSLSGSPALVRCESRINYRWGTDAPASGIPADNFSVRWSGKFRFDAGTYVFSATVDDGIRFWLDGIKTLEEWRSQSRSFSRQRDLTAGEHEITIEYYEGSASATAIFGWEKVGGLPSDPDPTATRTPTPKSAATATPVPSSTPTRTATSVPPTATSASGCPTNQYRALYYNNTSLSGTPKLSRCESGPIAYRWGTNAPASGIGADNFSVRWSGTHDFDAGTYTFRVFSDDGVRLRVDGVTILDQWKSQAAGWEIQRTLTDGPHQIEVDYYEGAAGATIEVGWTRSTAGSTATPGATATRTPTPKSAATSTPVPTATSSSSCPLGQYRAEFFANTTLSGTPVAARCEAAPISSDWQYGAPFSSLPVDSFSVRYVGRFKFPISGDYTFTANVDDGVRVWLNGTLLIDNSANRPGTYTAVRSFPPGVVAEEHELKVEFVEKGGGAKISFNWAQGSTAPTPTPTTTGSAPPPTCSTSVGSITVPSGFCLHDFATGLTAVRFMTYSPDGELYASLPSQGRIVRLPDANKDGVADGVYTFASGLNKPHGLVFHNGYLYVAETNSVTRVRDTNGDKVSDQTQRLAALPGDSVHWSRTIIVGSDGKLYVSIGSSCDACVETDARRATVMQFNADGTGGRVYSEGLRNAVGLARHPSTGQIWASGNERDGMGDNFPAEILSRLIDGADYGWPRCANGTTPDTRFTGGCGGVTPPVMTFQAHSAPLGIAFYTGTRFPSTYQGNLFMAFHGSWNRTDPTGYKIVRVPFSNGQPTGQVFDFATGWLRGDDTVLGRPVDVVTAPDGGLMVSDDRANRIYRIVYGTP
ncbi:MAG: PQQ-dependent sugar dehydrogenase [Chloroflexi bacterium]|nr:PQQ-dependent sugar dehydrogenase [Chloroflexota bacterium]